MISKHALTYPPLVDLPPDPPQHVENTIETTPYDETKIQGWINTITEKCMEELLGLNKPFKWVGEYHFFESHAPMCIPLLSFVSSHWYYVSAVSVCIMEQTGGGINTANSAYWDSVRDGMTYFLVKYYSFLI